MIESLDDHSSPCQHQSNEHRCPILSSQKDVDGLVSQLDELKHLLAGNVTGFMELQKQAAADQKEAEDLMNQIKAAQKVKHHRRYNNTKKIPIKYECFQLSAHVYV